MSIRVCILPYGVKVEGACECKTLVPHSHMSKSDAMKLQRSGDLRQIRPDLYQRTKSSNDKVHWVHSRSGFAGPVVLQLE